MRREKLRIVVLGMMGQTPFAGVAWQALHYLEGFRRLGHDVWYAEDTGDWPYDVERNTVADNSEYTIGYLERLMKWVGLEDRWVYRSAVDGNRLFGPGAGRFDELLATADALVNLTGTTWLREHHLVAPVRVYLETDPILPQILIAQGDRSWTEHLSLHTHHFTFAENLGEPDCGVPVGPFAYLATRQPVIMDWWSGAPVPEACEVASRCRFTTVGSWRQSGKDLVWNGTTYTWSKHYEFLKFIDLPGLVGQPLELALACAGRWQEAQPRTWVPTDPRDLEAFRALESHGWRVTDAVSLSLDIHCYRRYLQQSCGEFTVAKDQNVRLRSGWFSDRSACYLASGRPVVTQDTGFGCVLPTGDGLFAFRTMDEIVEALDKIAGDYRRQALRAREIAGDYFDATTVLTRLLEDAGF